MFLFMFIFFVLSTSALIVFHTYLPRLRKYSPNVQFFEKSMPAWRILHFSDLHLRKLGLREKLALRLVHQAYPDIIVVTGDILPDSQNIIEKPILAFFQNFRANIPVFIIRGNAEFVKPDAADPLAFLSTLPNVEILSNRVVTLQKNSRKLNLIALDPYVDGANHFKTQKRKNELHISGGGSWVDCFYSLHRSELSPFNCLSHFSVHGRVKVRSEQDLSGILVCNQIPLGRDRFYRLTFGGGYPIRFSCHGTKLNMGNRFSQQILRSNTWYKYKIEVQFFPNRTWLRAKVWPEGDSEPEHILIDCGDSTKTRIADGTIGYWSSRGGDDREYTLEKIYNIKKKREILFTDCKPDRIFEEHFVDEAPWSDLARLDTRNKLSRLMHKVPDKGLNVLLCHDPAIVTYLRDSNINIVLSGHTHGGQIRIPFLQKYFYPYSAEELSKIIATEKAGSPALVLNQGLGTSSIPVRLGARCEVLLVEV